MAVKFSDPPPPEPPIFGFAKPAPQFIPLGSAPGVPGVITAPQAAISPGQPVGKSAQIARRTSNAIGQATGKRIAEISGKKGLSTGGLDRETAARLTVRTAGSTAQNTVGEPVPTAGGAPVHAAASAGAVAAGNGGSREIVTSFFPLLNPAPPMERGEIIRIRVPASTLRSVGLPVPEDAWNQPVPADVLVGEEGLARAIRFVRVEQR
jgi:hypothetical protein